VSIVYTHQKSKKRKPNAKQRQLDADWKALLEKYTPKKNLKGTIMPQIARLLSPEPYVRETPKIPSLNSFGGSTPKKTPMLYTGNKMKGIGTLHKSNAVPIFTDEEAKDQANMRR